MLLYYSNFIMIQNFFYIYSNYCTFSETFYQFQVTFNAVVQPEKNCTVVQFLFTFYGIVYK